MNVSKNKTEKLDDPSDDDSSPSSPLEHVTASCCPRRSSMAFESSGRAYGADDETDIWQDDDHASPQGTAGMTKQTVESIERSLVEGHVTSRFPVSFARTRLPHHGHENGCTVTVSFEALSLPSHVQLAVISRDSGPIQQHRIKPGIENPHRGESQRSCYT
jgi:hypothetical protein